MNIKTYKNLRIAIIVAIGIAVVLSIVFNNVCAVLVAVAVALIVLAVIQRRVKDVVKDERTETIGNKAARLTVVLIGIGMPITGAVLVAIGWDTPASKLRAAGDGLLYATCALLVVNLLAYTYYNRKLGGK